MYKASNWRRLAIGTVSIVAVSAGLVVAAETDSQPTKAVWQVQELSLTYMGFTTHYSCDGMRDRVTAWLMELGAHENSKVTMGSCNNLSGPAVMPSVRIVLAMPMAADAAGAPAQDPKRAAVIEKLQHKAKEPFVDGSFDAVRKTVTLRSKDSSRGTTASGDCELLENFRDQVIKKIDARIVDERLRCTPHQGTAGSVPLKVEVLNRAPQ